MKQNSKQNRALLGLLKLCLTLTALTCGLAASAQTVTSSTNFTVNAIVPDGDASGLASVQNISTPITNLTGLRVALKIRGTWSGDLYCFLAHGTNQSVLLNRVGRSTANTLGYNDAGLDLIFDDSVTNSDIHLYRTQLTGSENTPLPGTLTGSFAPDARVANPANVLDSDERSAFLGSFAGVDPNGEWVLFVADMESGDVHMLENWGLEFTGEAPSVPEQ